MFSNDLSKIIKNKFGYHRGANFNLYEQNSLNAIRAAILNRPIFIEFDVVYQAEEVKTGHPPQKALDPLENVLKLFQHSQTYPKIDLKLKHDNNDLIFIDKTINLIRQNNISFALITIDSDLKQEITNEKKIKQSYYYLAKQIKNNPKIQLSLALDKIRKSNDQEIKNHLKYLKQKLYCLDLEIHENEWLESVQLAVKYNIPNFFFWLKTWPSVSNPQVSEDTILKALELENHYPIKVYFDINPEYVIGKK